MKIETIILTLFQKRKRRIWAYVFWLIIYCASFSLYALDRQLGWQILPFLVPIVVAINQIGHPTLFSWALITIPSFGFTIIYGCSIIYWLIQQTINKRQVDDEIGLVFIFIGFCIGVCIALAFSYPSKIDKHKNNGEAS